MRYASDELRTPPPLAPLILAVSSASIVSFGYVFLRETYKTKRQPIRVGVSTYKFWWWNKSTTETKILHSNDNARKDCCFVEHQL